MGQLVMSFRGLWMHVTDAKYLPDGVQHRVVAVDARNGATSQFGPLPAHHCYLEISSDISAALQRSAGLSFDPNLGSTGGMRFNGYRLTVANATDPVLKKVNWDAVPRLTDYSAMTLLPSITTETGAPTWADCYVDINQGSVTASAFPNGGGIYTTWTVETDGDPVLQLIAPPDGKLLTVAALDGGAQLSTPPNLTLSDGVPGSVVLHNSTTDATDGSYDFALYYLAREGGIPTSFKQPLPGEPPEGGGSVFPLPIVFFFDMGTSCSNSQYP